MVRDALDGHAPPIKVDRRRGDAGISRPGCGTQGARAPAAGLPPGAQPAADQDGAEPRLRHPAWQRSVRFHGQHRSPHGRPRCARPVAGDRGPSPTSRSRPASRCGRLVTSGCVRSPMRSRCTRSNWPTRSTRTGSIQSARCTLRMRPTAGHAPAPGSVRMSAPRPMRRRRRPTRGPKVGLDAPLTEKGQRPHQATAARQRSA